MSVFKFENVNNAWDGLDDFILIIKQNITNHSDIRELTNYLPKNKYNIDKIDLGTFSEWGLEESFLERISYLQKYITLHFDEANRVINKFSQSDFLTLFVNGTSEPISISGLTKKDGYIHILYLTVNFKRPEIKYSYFKLSFV